MRQYLDQERPGYWDRLTGAQLARLCHELNSRLYFDTKAIQTWGLDTCRVAYPRPGLTNLLHRLGFPYYLTTSLPYEAAASQQHAFLDGLAGLEAGKAVLYYVEAAYPTHTTRATCVWCVVATSGPCSRSVAASE
ncbi:MAG: hypothetical protein ACRYFX_00495 [Janthinobacterium lividum]